LILSLRSKPLESVLGPERHSAPDASGSARKLASPVSHRNPAFRTSPLIVQVLSGSESDDSRCVMDFSTRLATKSVCVRIIPFPSYPFYLRYQR